MLHWPRIVTIAQGPGRGTGFVVGPELVVTAAHVVRFSDMDWMPLLVGDRRATILKKNPSLDIALLKVPGLMGPVAQFDDAEAHEKVTFTGDVPRGPKLIAERVVHQGYIADVSFDPECRLLIGGASAMPGMSGCPVMNNTGEVIGMVVAVVTSYQSYPNFGNVLGVPTHDLIKFIEEDLNAVRQADAPGEGVTSCGPDCPGAEIFGPWCKTLPKVAD